jgi:eukaryotic-like serine/threonine-protein kinase
VKVEEGAGKRFRVIRPIGEGGMGVVYEAEDRERGQLVALKTLKHRDLDTLYRLKREFRALAHLSHPNLVDLYDMVVAEDTGFLTMELVEGSDIIRHCRPGAPGRDGAGDDSPSRADTDRFALEARPTPVDPIAPFVSIDAVEPIARARAARRARPPALRPIPARPQFDEARLRSVLPQLARALIALHQAGMVHRDIKPSNVLVTHSGRVVVLDFGLVAELDGGAGDSLGGRIVGTVEYIAPEQVSDGRVSPSADWYGFGCLLYEALTGRTPHHGSIMQILLDKQSHPPPPPRALVMSVPPDLDALCVDLLAIDPAARPTGADVLRRLGADDAAASALGSVSAATQTVAFAGRELELARLAECARQVEDGTAAVAAVTGVSGIGKTALVKRFLESLRRDAGPDLVVLEGRCYERESVPYKAIDSVIDQLARYWNDLPSDEAAELLPGNAPLLPRLFPVLGRVAAIAAAPRGETPPDLHELRQGAFTALRHVLRRLAVKRELVIFLDDLQWSDLDSIRLLADIMRPPDPPALLLLFCTRSDDRVALSDTAADLPSWEATVEASIQHAALGGLLELLAPWLARLEIGPLPPCDATWLAEQYLRGASPRLAERVAEEAGGVPLFIAELAIHMQTTASQDSRPVSFVDLLRRRIAQLPDHARELVELAAVSGEPISQRVAATALASAPESLGRAIRHLRTVNLVQAAGGRATDRVECYHARIRECVRAQLPRERVRACHRTLALALERWSEGSSAQLARHWKGAGDEERAGEHARAAAAEAARQFDFHRAARFYSMALAPGAGASPEERRALRIAMAGALASAGRPPEAAAAFREAADEADAVTALELRHQSAAALLRGGYVGEGLEAIEGVLRHIGLHAPRGPGSRRSARWRRRLLGLRWIGARRRGEGDVPRRALTEMDVCGSMAVALSLLDTERGAEYQARFLALALRHAEPHRLSMALALEAGYLAGEGSYRRAEAMVARAERVIAGARDDRATPYALWARGALALFRDSAWRAALDHFRRLMAVLRQQHRTSGWEMSTAEQYASLCQLMLGELALLAEKLPGAVRAADLRGDRYAALSARLRFGTALHLLRGQVDEAERDLDAAVADWAGNQRRGVRVGHYGAVLSRADLCLYTGRLDSFAAHWRLDADGLARSRLARYPIVLREVAQAAGRVALARGESDRARAFAALLRRDVAPAPRAQAALIEAGLAARAGDRAAAEALLERAAGALDGLAMAAHAAAARRALARLRGDPQLAAQADGFLRAQGAADPERFAAMMVPGID